MWGGHGGGSTGKDEKKGRWPKNRASGNNICLSHEKIREESGHEKESTQ